MKLNKDVAISTERVLLVPYEARHVPRYHVWMKDEEIQELTASEPLSLKEEYENQMEWREAHDKLTFILCRSRSMESGTGGKGEDREGEYVVRAGVDDGEEKMLGDINFFLYRDDNDEDPTNTEARRKAGGDMVSASKTTVPCYGEIDVMVAERQDRGKGVGYAAVCALLVYLQQNVQAILEEYRRGAQALGVVRLTRLVAKIKVANERSRALFKRLGFEEKGEVNYFGEVEMGLQFGRVSKMEWLAEAGKRYREVTYARDHETGPER